MFFLWFLLVFALTLPLLTNIFRAESWCLHATDLGIYQQAIFDLSNFKNLNPFVTVRNLNIFSDHVDPFITIPALLIRTTAPHLETLISFEWFLSALCPVILILHLLKNHPLKQRLLFSLIFLTSLLVMNYLTFPIHPTSWSVVFVALWMVKNQQNLMGQAFVYSLILLTLKEYFPFCQISFGIYLLFESITNQRFQKIKRHEFVRNLRWSIAYISSGILFSWLYFILRPRYFGTTSQYGQTLLSGIVSDPLSFAASTITKFDWLFHLYLFAPLAIIVYATRHNDQKRKPLLFFLSFILPIALIQYIHGSVTFHHGAPLAGILLGFILINKKAVNNKLLLLVLTLSFSHSFYKFESMLKFWTSTGTESCSTHKDKNVLNRKITDTLTNEDKVVSSGGIIPAILKPNRKIYQLGLWNPPDLTFQHLILCKTPYCDSYPFGSDKIDQIKTACRPPDLKVIEHNDLIYWATGTFTSACLH